MLVEINECERSSSAFLLVKITFDLDPAADPMVLV